MAPSPEPVGTAHSIRPVETTGNRRWSRAEIAALVLVLACAGAIRVRTALLPIDYLANMHLLQYKAGTILLEDSFYTLNIARNFTLGRGITHDGVHPTTGVQPLAMLIASIGYRCFPGDPDLPVHLFLLFLAAVSVAAMAVLYGLCRILAGPWAGFFPILVWAAAPAALMQVNGLETSLSVFLNLCLVALHARFMSRSGTPDESPSGALGWGALAGLAVFARLDAVILVALLLVHRVFANTGRGTHPSGRLRWAMTASAAALVVYMPWLWMAQAHTGRIGYDSGIARRQIALRMAGEPIDALPSPGFYLDNLVEMGRALAEMHPLIRPWLVLPGPAPTAVLAGGIIAVAVLLIRCRFTRTQKILFTWMTGYAVVFCCAYIFYQFGRDFYHRYLATVIMLSMCPAGIAAHKLNRYLRSVSLRLQRVAVPVLLLAIVMPPFLKTADYVLNHRDRTEYYQSRYYRFSGMARWFRENTPENARIGAFQTGQLSYYSGRTVINLDGIVNREACRAIRNRVMASYVRSLNLDYLADWDLMIRRLLQEVSSEPLEPEELELVYSGYFKVYRFSARNLDTSALNSL